MNRVYALVITALFAVLTACPGGGGGPESAPQVPPSKPLTFTHPIGQAGDSGDAGLTAEVPLVSAATCQSLLQNKQPLPDQCAALFASLIEKLPSTPGAESCVYTYSNWDVCQKDGTQTRVALSPLPANCTGKPVLIQHCDPTLPSTPTVCVSGGTTYSVGGTVGCDCSDGTKGSQACQKDGSFSQCGCENKPATPPVCVVGQTLDCESATGESGKLHCKPDGSGYGVCQTCSASTWADCKTANNESGQKQCKSDGSSYGACETFCEDPIGSVICDVLKAIKEHCEPDGISFSIPSLVAHVSTSTDTGPLYNDLPVSVVGGKATLTLKKKQTLKSVTFTAKGGLEPVSYETNTTGATFDKNVMSLAKSPTNLTAFDVNAVDSCGQTLPIKFEVIPFFELPPSKHCHFENGTVTVNMGVIDTGSGSNITVILKNGETVLAQTSIQNLNGKDGSRNLSLKLTPTAACANDLPYNGLNKVVIHLNDSGVIDMGYNISPIEITSDLPTFFYNGGNLIADVDGDSKDIPFAFPSAFGGVVTEVPANFGQ